MKLFKLKRVSDQQILFIQKHESINQVKVPTGWNLENNLEIIEEEIPAPSYADLRKVQYALRIDPKIAEAITDQAAGDNTSMQALLAEKAAIKLEIPKPE